MRLINSLIFNSLFIIFSIASKAQVNAIVVLESAQQISSLKNGILIIELPPAAEKGIRTNSSEPVSNERSTEEVRALKESFIKNYLFSEYYFYQKQQETDKYVIYESIVENIQGEIINLNILNNKEVFIAEYVTEYIDKPECYYLKNGKPSSKIKAAHKNINGFSQESSLYNPEILVEGGIIIRRYSPKIKIVNKKKSLVSDFVYKRRVHLTLPVKDRFNECVNELNIKLEKDYNKALKYTGN